MEAEWSIWRASSLVVKKKDSRKALKHLHIVAYKHQIIRTFLQLSTSMQRDYLWKVGFT